MTKIGQFYLDSLPNPMAAVRQQGGGDPNAYGANVGQAMGNLGQAFGQMGEVEFQEQQRQQEKRRKMNVINAESSAKREIFDNLYGDGGLLQLKGENALAKVATKGSPAVPGVGERTAKFLQDTGKKYMDGLDDMERMVFSERFSDLTDFYTRAAIIHERKENDFVFQQSREASRNSYANQIALNAVTGNYEEVVKTINLAMGDYNSTGKTLGIPQEVLAQENKNWGSKTMGIIIVNQAKAGKLDLALDLQTRFGSYLDTNTKALVESTLKPIVDQDELVKYREELKSDPSNYTNGVFDPEKAKVKANLKYGVGVTKEVTIPGKMGSDEYFKMAQQVSEKTGVPAELIYGQWYHESSGFSSQLARENNNFGGVTQISPNDSPQPDGSNYYMKFNSPQEYADYYASLIQKYPEAKNAKTPEEFAHVLKQGGYYTDSEENYAGGIKSGMDNIYHLSGGTPATTRTVSAFDAGKMEKMYALIDAAGTDSLQAKNFKNGNEIERVKNSLVGQTDSDKINIIHSSNLEPHLKDLFIRQVASQKVSDIGAMAALEKMAAQGALTEQDVINAAPFLDQEKTLHYLGKAYAIGSKNVDQQSTDADKQWHAYIDEKGPYAGSGDKKQNDELIVNITGRLNAEGLKGYPRFDRAVALMQEEKNNKGSIRYYALNNNGEYQQLIKDFDPRMVDLTVSGFKASGQWTGSYRDVNVFLSEIGRDIQAGDPWAQGALDLLLETNMVINPATYQDARSTVQGGV